MQWPVDTETLFPYVMQYVFMDMSTYEETRVKGDDAWIKYLKEGMDVGVVIWNGKVISVDLPNTVELQVVETDPGVKGNTAQGEQHGVLFAEAGSVDVWLLS